MRPNVSTEYKNNYRINSCGAKSSLHYGHQKSKLYLYLVHPFQASTKQAIHNNAWVEKVEVKNENTNVNLKFKAYFQWFTYIFNAKVIRDYSTYMFAISRPNRRLCIFCNLSIDVMIP